MVFKDPWVLLALLGIIPFVLFQKKREKAAHFLFSSTQLVSGMNPTWKMRYKNLPFYLRLIVLGLFVIALAGPRLVIKETKHEVEGIDIVIAIDTSGSMAAEDFTLNNQRMNRLEVVKNVVEDFISQRPNDRLGLVAFSALAYTVCPLTTDHNWLRQNFDRLQLGMIQDGTAIGSAIMASITRLKKSDAKSKIVILLTDGVNNAGKIDPLTAAKTAQTFDIKIYTIGTGTKGMAPFPVTDIFGRKLYQPTPVDIDEDMLTKVADTTQGKYYRATDTDSLRQIYKEIDRLEKTKIEDINYFEYEELFVYVLGAALVLLLLQVILEQTVFMRIP